MDAGNAESSCDISAEWNSRVSRSRRRQRNLRQAVERHSGQLVVNEGRIQANFQKEQAMITGKTDKVFICVSK